MALRNRRPHFHSDQQCTHVARGSVEKEQPTHHHHHHHQSGAFSRRTRSSAFSRRSVGGEMDSSSVLIPYHRHRRKNDRRVEIANSYSEEIIYPSFTTDYDVSRNTRIVETGSTRMEDHQRRRDSSVATERERLCMNNAGWLHHREENGYSFNFSSTTTKTTASNHRRRDNLDWPIFMFILTLLFTVTDACSTRPSPKPRPPRPMWTPDLGYAVKENCTDDYAELYCMNAGKCYRQKILETFIVSCECQPGFVGTRCQYRDVPDKFLPVQQRIETASIAGGVTVVIIIATVFSILAWLYYRRRRTFVHVASTGVLSAGPV